ncbi:hypothetical protein I551_5852 [Mycobacterium ulcerans str. Harvey]|uniref:Uncharacterized protein n=1 Tax=Mycobacterium ulcerans str. Harvey TaxID=1299332 RepID=A0ABN0QSR6_MYCUL|nr:hypothetical protein I551_5852 [Mycobacterium ulcerans str. Harvey]
MVGKARLGPANAALDQTALAGERNVGVNETVEQAGQLGGRRNVGGRGRCRVLRQWRTEDDWLHLVGGPAAEVTTVTP